MPKHLADDILADGNEQPLHIIKFSRSHHCSSNIKVGGDQNIRLFVEPCSGSLEQINQFSLDS